MKKQVKIFVLLMAVCAMIFQANITDVHAASSNGIWTNQSVVQAGQTFNVNFTIPPIDKKVASFQLNITFNNNAFEVSNPIVPDFSGAQTQSNDISGNRFAVMAYGQSGESTINLSVGMTISLTVKTKENVTPANYNFTVSTYIVEHIPEGDWQGVSCVPSGYTDNASVSVKPHVSGVTLNPTNVSLKIGQTTTLSANVQPSDAYNTEVTYSSNNPAVAIVNGEGVVTATGEGTAVITVTTVDGGKTATCIVTVPHTLQAINASSSSCTSHGNNTYYKCVGCNQYFKDANATTATTVEAEKLPLISHSLKAHSEVGATHGNIAYWTCNKCNGYFKDVNGTQSITKEQTVIGATGHNYILKYDKTNHWKECSCGSKIEEAGHSYSMKYDNANHWRQCACGHQIEVVKHNYMENRDNANHWKECACGSRIEEAAHNYVQQYDKVNHWKECVCGSKIEEGGHTLQWVVDKAPTEAETGLQHQQCTSCVYRENDNTSIDKLVHQHKIQKIDAKVATCTENGNKEYYKCTSCNKVYEDANATKEISLESTIIKATGHGKTTFKFDEENHWEVCTVEGCGAEITSTRETHIDEDGDYVCDTCKTELEKETSSEEESSEASSEEESTESTTEESLEEKSTEESNESSLEESNESSSEENTSDETNENNKPEDNKKDAMYWIRILIVLGIVAIIIALIFEFRKK